MLGRTTREPDTAELETARARIAELEEKLASSGDHDPATGLLTLRRFRVALDIEADRARRHGRALAVAVLDVDGFRELNGHHGLDAGDAVLCAVAEALERNTRSHDTACRSSGDEFALLMPETDVAGASVALERIVSELTRARLGAIEGVSMSVGLAAFGRDQTPRVVLASAGRALNRARSEGGGRLAVGDGPTGEVSNDQRDAVEALAMALLERDRYTGEHSQSVLELVDAVGRNLGLSEQEVERVRSAALLHDVGKVAIPDEVLNKPAGLTEAEFAIMRDHTVIGERILRAIPGMETVARIVRHEHERWDGGGYPDGLAGSEIPIGSRIILACDAYHAMVSDRPYRAAMSHADAIAELSANAGTQFDPEVCEILVGCLYGRRQGAGVAV